MPLQEMDRVKNRNLITIITNVREKKDETRTSPIVCQIKGPNLYKNFQTEGKKLMLFFLLWYREYQGKYNLHHTGSSPCLVTLRRNGWP